MFEEARWLRPDKTSGESRRWYAGSLLMASIGLLSLLMLGACGSKETPPEKDPGVSAPEPESPAPEPESPAPEPESPAVRVEFLGALAELNSGPCKPADIYEQDELEQPLKVGPMDGIINTELVVRLRERCVPVWVQPPTPEGSDTPPEPGWEMQSLRLRTYGFPRDPSIQLTDADADDPNSPNIAWSAPGPTFVMYTASEPGAGDGTRFKMRLYNRMPHDDDPHACVPNAKCNSKGPRKGFNPETGDCRQPILADDGGFPPTVPSQVVDGQVIEPPNCFHGNNSTNFHFHGFHVSPQLGQDFVGLELRPPLEGGASHDNMPEHSTHGKHGEVRYGHFDYDVDPLRYTQPPGTHWYHAHKHGSTALQVLNGLVGTFEVRGEFDAALDKYFETSGGGKLTEKLMVIQQLQEYQPGLAGADHNLSVLVNGQANPIVKMAKGEIQRWRFVSATMQASAALRIGFPDTDSEASTPKVRQIAMDGVQFSPDNYECQPFLNNPDCGVQSDEGDFQEFTTFSMSPGNRMDFLVQAPTEAGRHCMVYDITSKLNENMDVLVALEARATSYAGSCGVDPNSGLGPLFTLVVEDKEKPMIFPNKSQFPPLAPYLADIPEVTDSALKKDIYYQMVDQFDLEATQFWISQVKYNPDCANETLVLDRPEEWTLWNNSLNVAHPFHIHQNPFQLLSESDRTPSNYKYPVWRDTMAIPKATTTDTTKPPSSFPPNSDPKDPANLWGNSKIRYVAKEFTGLFVNHCHILGHEDRGMMHNTQSTCADGKWGVTGPVPPGAECDEEGFCRSDCADGERLSSTPQCAAPPPQQSKWWPEAYGVE